MSTISRTFFSASLAVLSTTVTSQAATRSSTFNVSAEVVSGCAITLDEGARPPPPHRRTPTRPWRPNARIARPYNVARGAALPAPFSASRRTRAGRPGRAFRAHHDHVLKAPARPRARPGSKSLPAHYPG
jgi:hypothetical protein